MKKLIGLLVVAVMAIFVMSCNEVPEEIADSSSVRLVWNDDPTSTISIVWDGKMTEEATIYYGTKDQGRKYWKYSHSQTPYRTFDYYDMNTNYLKLSDLEADKAYYFVLKDSDGLSDRFWFRTAPDQPKPFTFVAGGDTKSDGDALEAGRSSNRAVGILRPLFVLFNGDFTSGNGTDANNWKKWISDWNSMTTTQDGRMTPVVAVHGNHENGNKGNLNFIFDSPYQDNDSSNIFYSFNVGGDLLHLIALNSQIEVGGLQRDWLEEDLKEHQLSTFKVAGYHKPFWPHHSGKGENLYQYKQWAFLFQDYGLSLSFDADSHIHKITYPLRADTTSENNFMGYVRDDVNGTMFIGEGSWGAHPRATDDDKPWTMASGTFNQIKWLHVFPEENGVEAHMDIYTIKTASYDEEGKITLYNDDVEALTEENRFSVPEGLELYINEEGKDFVTYPYK